MLTLAQSADLCQDRLIKGVMKAILFHSPLLQRLPFDDIMGNADAWNIEDPSNPPAVDPASQPYVPAGHSLRGRLERCRDPRGIYGRRCT